MAPDWRRLISGTDIRGEETVLTDEMAERLGYAFASWLAEENETTPDKLKIAVGMDSRRSGPRLKSAVIRGVTSADTDVLDCAMCTTPAMFMLVGEGLSGAHGGIMLTASRQNPNKNGFKFITPNGSLREDELKRILELADEKPVPVRLVKPMQLMDVYEETIKKQVRDYLEDDSLKPLLGLHVVVDAGNGTGGFYARVLEDLGAWVEGSLHLEPDGEFPNLVPDPQSPEALKRLADAVLKNEADLGVIFDADCDRVAFVDNAGKPINGNRLIALVAVMLLEESPNATIVTDSVTSSGLSKFIAEWGGVHYRYMRGSFNVIREAKRLNEEGIDCPLAIETSGHAAFRENHFLDDGMYLATQLICEAMCRKRDGETLFSMVEDLQEPVESLELRLNIFDPSARREAVQEVSELVLSNTLDDPSWRLASDNREGVRILFDLGGEVESAWFQLRLSVHDPVVPLKLESDVPGGVHHMLKELYALIKDCELLDVSPVFDALSKYTD